MTNKESFKDKVDLIYEYDEKTPLFVRKAFNEIEKNNNENAIEILKKGIEHYSFYPVPYFILGKAYTITGEYKLAEEAFIKGAGLINSSKTLTYYLNELEKNKKERILFEGRGRGNVFYTKEREVRQVNDEPVIIPEEKIEKLTVDKIDVNDQLEELAQKLVNAKKPQIDHESEIKEIPQPVEEKKIVSETLANIYIAQGEYKEAVKVYEALLQNNPARKGYYLNRIKEIKEQLDMGEEW